MTLVRLESMLPMRVRSLPYRFLHDDLNDDLDLGDDDNGLHIN